MKLSHVPASWLAVYGSHLGDVKRSTAAQLIVRLGYVASLVSDSEDLPKDQLVSLQKAWLKEFVSALGLAKEAYEVKVNRGGYSVLADVCFRSDALHLSFGMMTGQLGLMFRATNGRRDYVGRGNQWISPQDFARMTPAEAARLILARTGSHPDLLAGMDGRRVEVSARAA